MRMLAVYVAEGDGTVCPGEGRVIDDIFWLDQLNTSNGRLSVMLAEQPERVTGSLDYLARVAKVVARNGQPATLGKPDEDLICRAADAVFGPVLAHDDAAEPEVMRLAEANTRLRQAVFADAPLTGDDAAACAAARLAALHAELAALVCAGPRLHTAVLVASVGRQQDGRRRISRATTGD